MDHKERLLDFARSMVSEYYVVPKIYNDHRTKIINDAPGILSCMSEHERDKLLALYLEYLQRDFGYDAFADTTDKLMVMLLNNNEETKKDYADAIRDELLNNHLLDIAELLEGLCNDHYNSLLNPEDF